MLRVSHRVRSSRRVQRHQRLRARVHGTFGRPRLSVFRSKQHLLAQLIDDDAGRTMLAAHDKLLPKNLPGKRGVGQRARSSEAAADAGGSPGVARAFALGELLAKRAKDAGISRAVFDRGGYAYHGRVKAVADGARAGGLEL